MKLFAVVTLALVLGTSSGSKVWNRFRLTRPEQFGGEYSYIKINPKTGNGPPLEKNSWFGYACTRLGDLNEDGIEDLAVGAYGESYYSVYNNTVSRAAGAVYILFMSRNFTVLSYERISGQRGGNKLDLSSDPLIKFVNNDNFGFSLATIGDLDGDGKLLLI